MLSLTKLRGNAACGARFFDRSVPGWHTKIDVEKLDINNTDDCIAGQIYGSYKKAVELLGITKSHSMRLGIYLSCSDVAKAEKRQWENLTLAWQHEIKARLEKDAREITKPAKDIVTVRTTRVKQHTVATRS